MTAVFISLLLTETTGVDTDMYMVNLFEFHRHVYGLSVAEHFLTKVSQDIREQMMDELYRGALLVGYNPVTGTITSKVRKDFIRMIEYNEFIGFPDPLANLIIFRVRKLKPKEISIKLKNDAQFEEPNNQGLGSVKRNRPRQSVDLLGMLSRQKYEKIKKEKQLENSEKPSIFEPPKNKYYLGTPSINRYKLRSALFSIHDIGPDLGGGPRPSVNSQSLSIDLVPGAPGTQSKRAFRSTRLTKLQDLICSLPDARDSKGFFQEGDEKNSERSSRSVAMGTEVLNAMKEQQQKVLEQELAQRSFDRRLRHVKKRMLQSNGLGKQDTGKPMKYEFEEILAHIKERKEKKAKLPQKAQFRKIKINRGKHSAKLGSVFGDSCRVSVNPSLLDVGALPLRSGPRRPSNNLTISITPSLTALKNITMRDIMTPTLTNNAKIDFRHTPKRQPQSPATAGLQASKLSKLMANIYK